MFYITSSTFYLHLFLCSMMVSMSKVLTGLIESWMLYIDKEKYGFYRAMGALGLCIGSPIAGLIMDYFSNVGLFYAGIFSSILVLLLSYFCKEVSYLEKIHFKQILSLFKNKEYVYMMLIYFLIYVVGTADQYIVIEKMIKLNASSFWIGVKWAIQSLMEIPFFLYASKILKKYNPTILLGIGIIMYGIKFILYGMSSSIFFIILTTSLQIVTLPVVAYTSKIVFEKLAPDLKASSQMIAMAFFMSGSAFVTPILSSFLTPYLGYDFTLYIFASISVLPFLLLLFKKRVLKNESMV